MTLDWITASIRSDRLRASCVDIAEEFPFDLDIPSLCNERLFVALIAKNVRQACTKISLFGCLDHLHQSFLSIRVTFNVPLCRRQT